MNFIKYFGIVLLMLSLNSCHKPEIIDDTPYYSMDPEFKKTFLQGWEGSYWIYSDSTGTIFDTVTLVSAGIGKSMPINLDNDYQGEAYSTHYDATNCEDYFTRLGTYRNIVNDSVKIYYQFDFRTNSATEFSINLRDGKYSPEQWIEQLDSIKLRGKTYYNVTKLSRGTKIIIDPEIGIIYKEAWSKRPFMGTKEFYLIDYKLTK